MRLAQLARKLQIRPSDIVEFVSSQNIPTEEGLNARLEDEHVILIVKHFAPALLNEIVNEITPVAEIPAPVPVLEEIVIEEITPEIINEPIAIAAEVTQTEEEKNEVIKASKVELQGLKVLGKIELPEPKKKEEPKTEGEEQVTSEDKIIRKTDRKPRSEARRKPTTRDDQWRNPIAQQREKEAREAEEKKQLKAKKEKELRTLRYQKKVNKVAPPKSSRYVSESLEDLPKEAPAPKTWLGRFLRWLKA